MWWGGKQSKGHFYIVKESIQTVIKRGHDTGSSTLNRPEIKNQVISESCCEIEAFSLSLWDQYFVISIVHLDLCNSYNVMKRYKSQGRKRGSKLGGVHARETEVRDIDDYPRYNTCFLFCLLSLTLT